MAAPTVCIRDPHTGHWWCQGSVDAWPAQLTEAAVGAMQAQPPDPALSVGERALAQWLRLINPPAPDRGPHD